MNIRELTTSPTLLLCVATMVAGLSLLSALGCGADTTGPADTSVPPPPLVIFEEVPTATPWPTPDPSFEPTVGLLAPVPIGRMRWECWGKASTLGPPQPRWTKETGFKTKSKPRDIITISCEAVYRDHQLYLELWRYVGDDLGGEYAGLRVSFVYLDASGRDSGETIICDDLIFYEGTYDNARGSPLKGACAKQVLPKVAVALRVEQAIADWTSLPGVGEPLPSDALEKVFGVLKG